MGLQPRNAIRADSSMPPPDRHMKIRRSSEVTEGVASSHGGGCDGALVTARGSDTA